LLCVLVWQVGLQVLVLPLNTLGSSTREGNDEVGASSERTSIHEVYGWGLNSVGQLGLVDFQDRRKPALLSVLKGKNITHLAVGGSEQVDSQTLAIVSPGKLFTAGDNTYGQLGVGDNTDRESFEPVQAVFQKTFVAVACGEAHSVALADDGEVYVWGSNTRGQLCMRDNAAQSSVPTALVLPLPDPVVGVTAGAWHTVVWTAKGSVFACGDNTYGQLGAGDQSAQQGLVQVILPKDLQVKEVAAGGHHNILLSKTGELYAWGKNSQAQLGLQREDLTKEAYATPELVPSFSEAALTRVFAGYMHSMALDQHAALHAWGENSQGQLGVMVAGAGSGGGGQFASRSLHAPRVVMPATKWAHVACGRMHTVAVTVQGKAYAWGANQQGQLGLGDLAARSIPQSLTHLGTTQALYAAAGSFSTLAINEAGELYGWGKNSAGQLGLPRSKAPRLRPDFVMSATEQFSVVQVAAGGYAYQYEGHSMLLTGNSEVYTWGWNAFGQLGMGEVDDAHSVPQRNSWLHKLTIQAIAVGQFTSAAITADGELYTWGQNDCGQLGKGDFSSGPVDIPQRVHLDVAVVKVAIGYSHMLALSVEGRVFSWGHNFYGQLGVGDHKDKNIPQLISYLQEERILKIVAGQYHSLAVSVNGEVYGWGYNRDYELGVGDNMDRVLPQAVPSLTGRKVTSLAAGGYHTLAVTEDGTLYSWGLNNYGQLGHKEHSTSKVPTVVIVTVSTQDGKQVGKRLRVKSVAAGTWHSLVLAENNAVYAFGRCQYGQLGVQCHSNNGRAQDVFMPERVVDDLEGKRVVAIAAGAAHSLAVVSSG